MVFFGFQNSVVPFGCRGKTFLSTLKVMILQTVRNECIRFAGHVDIEVSYKILWSNVLMETQNLHNLSYFE
jgi:hypothetical protein